MRQTFELACYRGDCACPNKDHFSHPTANAKAFTPPFVFHNWRTGKNEPLEVWRKESDEAPHCSKRCATAQSKKGHLSSCRRLKALVEGGWMHPCSLKRRKASASKAESGGHGEPNDDEKQRAPRESDRAALEPSPSRSVVGVHAGAKGKVGKEPSGRQGRDA